MRKACCDCTHLSSYGMGTVSCQRHPTQHVADPFEHVLSFVCDNFQPKFLFDPEPRMLRALRCAKEHSSDALRAALTRWFSGPPNDVDVATGRGLPLLSVADGDLDTFEGDRTLKSYLGSNHVFADVFGGVEIRWPVISYLSMSNPAGVRVETLGDGTVSVIHLGRPYSLAEVTAAFSFVLAQQGVQLVRPWFRRHLLSAGVDPEDPSFARFRALPEEIELFLAEHRDRLVQSSTAVSVSHYRPDLEAIAAFLGMREGDYGVLWCDARRLFHLTRRGETRYEFAVPSEVGRRVVEEGMCALLVAPDRYDALWLEVAADALSAVTTLLVFVDSAGRDWLKGVPCFASCRHLEIDSDGGWTD